MFLRLFIVCFLVLPCSIVFGQKKFTVVKDLRGDWTRFDDGAYVPVDVVPISGLKTVYLSLDAYEGSENYLRLNSDEPYHLFVNGKIRGAFRGEVRLNIDSLFRLEPGVSKRVALHQDGINARDLNTEIISFRSLARDEQAAIAARPYSHFRDFVVVAAVLLVLLFVAALRLNPKLAADYFSITRLLSSRESDDSQASARLTSGANVQFYFLSSLMIGFYLLIILYNLPQDYALPIRFEASQFGSIWLQWLKLSAIIFVLFLCKIFIVYTLTRLFGMRGMARFHFFNWVRLLLVVFTFFSAVLFMYFIARGSHPQWYVGFLMVIVIALMVWTVVAYFKLAGRSGHSMFHLFSYLCATEIIPLLITVKVLFQ